MNAKADFRYIDDDFESYLSDNLGVIKIKNNVFEIVTDIPESSKFLDTLDFFESEHKVSAIVIFNEKDSLGHKDYKKYLDSIFAHENDEQKWSQISSARRMTRTREIVILNNIIKKFIHSSKFIVAALNGEIVTPFFGASLAMDLRIASENVSFLLSHLEMDVHPSGALPYFLPKYIGHAKASNLLYGRDKISVKEALELGLVSEILREDRFEETVLKKVKERISQGKNVIGCTKKLFNSNFMDLEKYLNIEESDFQQK